MTVKVSQKNLAKMLSLVSKIVAPKSAIPILEHVCLSTDGQALKLSATNREIGVVIYMPAVVDEDMSVTVPARLFTELTNQLTDDVELELGKGMSLSVASGKVRSTLKGLDPDDFPAIRENVAKSRIMNATAEQLVSLGKSVSFCVSRDDSRPTLRGVQVDMGSQLKFAATDGYRLAVRMTGDAEDESESLIVPGESLDYVAQVLSSVAGESIVGIQYNQGNSQILFCVGEGSSFTKAFVSCELFDGKYPDYAHIVPKQSTTKVLVERAEFLQAVRRCMLFGRDDANIVGFDYDPASGPVIRLSSKNSEHGETVSEIAATATGDLISIAFNGKYLISAMEHIDAVSVEIQLTMPTRPALLRPVGEDRYFQVIMPMQRPGGA